MRAAFIKGVQRFEVRDVILPPPGPEQLLLDVIACGVCGTNLHDWYRGSVAGLETPGAVGHEILASVVVAGSEVSGFAAGDTVVINPSAIAACQVCTACRDGAAWFCSAKNKVASYGFAEQMLVPASTAYALPPELDGSVAVLAEPLACGVHAIRHSWTARGTGCIDGCDVVVIGAGMLGLAAALASRSLGASSVTIVARYQHQATAAEACGADVVLAADAADLRQVLRSLRPAIVVEAVGAGRDTIEIATECAAWRSEIIVLGVFEGPPQVDLGRLTDREVRLFMPISYASRDGVHDFDVALDILAKSGPRLVSLVTHRFPLDAIDEAFATAADKRSGAIRVVVGSGG